MNSSVSMQQGINRLLCGVVSRFAYKSTYDRGKAEIEYYTLRNGVFCYVSHDKVSEENDNIDFQSEIDDLGPQERFVALSN